ncbi:MAG: hypothetical protein U0J65_01365 [Christensenellales bacterium]|nr:hypothetical protein [Christensenellales bacterium]
MEEREMERTALDAQTLTDELMEEEQAQEAQADAQEEAELEARLREGIGMLFEDGWTGEELEALAQDEGVRGDVAQGIDLMRAAARMLHSRLMQPVRRRGVPVARSSAAGTPMMDNRIDAMSDAQFDAFSRQARAAAMMGRKVRM